MSKVYEIITEKIIEQLEKGVIPWRKPWVNNGAVNWLTQKAYRGINCMLLEAGEYATFKQITDAGGKVKKGAKSEMVVFWKMNEYENKEGETNKIPMLRYYNVFNIANQVEGLESKRNVGTFEHDPIESGEEVLKQYINSPELRFASGRAYYRPSMDYVSVPSMKDYQNPNEYYSVLFHEMIHSTGHKSRLNREGITELAGFGSETYSKEELVAEMGAAMLCGVAKIDNHTIENSASYIASWLGKLKNDKKIIMQAAGQAQKAADYILGVTFEKAAQ
jgi:antirestriction protein ArdC